MYVCMYTQFLIAYLCCSSCCCIWISYSGFSFPHKSKHLIAYNLSLQHLYNLAFGNTQYHCIKRWIIFSRRWDLNWKQWKYDGRASKILEKGNPLLYDGMMALLPQPCLWINESTIFLYACYICLIKRRDYSSKLCQLKEYWQMSIYICYSLFLHACCINFLAGTILETFCFKWYDLVDWIVI